MIIIITTIKPSVKCATITTMNLYRTLVPEKIEFYVKALALLFIIAGAFGFIVAQQFPSEAGEAIENTIRELSFIGELSQIEIFFVILLNNSLKAFFMMLLGTLFGVIPVIFILLNGYAIGVVISVMTAEAGITSILLGILPHGIFEIPAILIAAGYGVWLGEMFSKKLRNKNTFTPNLKIVFKKYINIILPIILLSALIETFLTDELLALFLV